MGLQNIPQPPAYQQTSYHHNHKKVINEIHENKDNNKDTLDYITELNTQRQAENQDRALITDKQNEERGVKLAQAIDRLATPESSIYEEQNVISKENPLTMEYNQQGQTMEYNQQGQEEKKYQWMPKHEIEEKLQQYQTISHKVRKLEKEERIFVVEVQSEPVKIVLINNYMPTMATGSEKEYREHLDKHNSMIEKYEQTQCIHHW
ncbi:unnamed protein product [Mytilus coruscus]|uniref:Uncharacterized protein n=1 Tax=Mytilus coruscus TaxID=42192 RepID=A0A6J8CRY8_MYTCO|nr:unnamed protein product [Mytilus coruscus]